MRHAEYKNLCMQMMGKVDSCDCEKKLLNECFYFDMNLILDLMCSDLIEKKAFL